MTARNSRRDLHQPLALLVLLFGGIGWLAALYAAVSEAGAGMALLWTACAVALGVDASVRALRAQSIGGVWWAPFRWWLESLVAPLFALVLVLRVGASMRVPAPQPATPAPGLAEEDVMDPLLRQRLDDLELRIGALDRELRQLRQYAQTSATRSTAPWEPVSGSEPQAREQPAIRVTKPVSGPGPISGSEPQSPPAPPRASPLDDLLDGVRRAVGAELSGARALAWAGGVVTLLGIVFFFVLAVNRGWIGPGVRVACGALASSLVFGVGVVVRRRYGNVLSSLAAVGVGIAGGYVTLLAATALYDLVPRPLALVVAAGIAALGLWIALLWESEFVAGLGLVGAIVAPAALALQSGDVSPLGTAFAALVFGAAAAVAVRQRWQALVDVAAVAALPQVGALVLQADGADAAVLAVTGGFWLLLLGIALAWQWRLDSPALDLRATTYAVGSAVFASLATGRLLDGTAEWLVLFAIAAAYLGLALALLLRERLREAGVLLLAAALAVGAIATADALAGASLSIAWAAEGALLVWLAARTRELRLELAGFAYLSAAAVHALTVEAPPAHLWSVTPSPADGAQGVAVVAFAALFAAAFGGRTREPRPDAGVLRRLAPALAVAHRHVAERREAPLWGGLTLALYAAALGILGLSQLGSLPVQTAFEHGHVVVTAFWAAAALAAVVLAPRVRHLGDAGFVWLGVTFVNLVGFDLTQLPSRERSLAALAFGFSALLIAQVQGWRFGPRIDPGAAVALIASVPCLFGATVGLVGGDWHGIDLEGAALLGLAAVYVGLAAIDLRPRRDLATALWAVGLGIAAVGSAELLEGSLRALAWAGAAAALALLAVGLREDRLFAGAGSYLALALAQAFGHDAPPSHLFVARSQPAGGAAGLVAVIGSVLVVERCLRGRPRFAGVRRGLLAGACVLAVYTCSLGLLELFEHIGSADLRTSFQRGHTAVSTFWGLIGVALLYAGLVTGRRTLRLGGLGLLVLGLAKIFLYDLPNLSSVTRALSFLGVGALLLVGGFFYQRLSTNGGGDAPAAR